MVMEKIYGVAHAPGDDYAESSPAYADDVERLIFHVHVPLC